MKGRPWQRKLKAGDYAWRPYLFTPPKPGHMSLHPVGTYVDIFMELVHSPHEEDRARLADMPDYRMVNAFSAVQPGGPEGDYGQIVPVWTMVPITGALWAEAKRRTWALDLRGFTMTTATGELFISAELLMSLESEKALALDFQDGKVCYLTESGHA